MNAVQSRFCVSRIKKVAKRAMIKYKIIRYCRLCKKRMVLQQDESRRNYCSKCQLKFNNIDNC